MGSDGSIIAPLAQAHARDLARLHELFPETYYSGAQLLEQASAGDATLLGLVEGGVPLGFASARVDTTGDGYLDFVGVAREARGTGRGRQLVVTVCEALVADRAVSKVSETVSSDNGATLRLYNTLGFRQATSLVGYRRRYGPVSPF